MTQLWTDERIDANAKMARWEMGGAISLVEPDKTILAIKKVATFVRDDLQQRIDALEAENAKLRAMMPSAEVRAALRFLYGSEAADDR